MCCWSDDVTISTHHVTKLHNMIGLYYPTNTSQSTLHTIKTVKGAYYFAPLILVNGYRYISTSVSFQESLGTRPEELTIMMFCKSNPDLCNLEWEEAETIVVSWRWYPLLIYRKKQRTYIGEKCNRWMHGIQTKSSSTIASFPDHTWITCWYGNETMRNLATLRCFLSTVLWKRAWASDSSE